MLYELTDVTKRYTQRRKQIDALAGIDLTIDEGEFLAIQGSTGSGKTTLLQMLGAMDRPSGGKLEFEGRDLVKMGEGDLSELRSHSFGFIFQGFNLIPTLTAQENVETALVPWHVHARRAPPPGGGGARRRRPRRPGPAHPLRAQRRRAAARRHRAGARQGPPRDPRRRAHRQPRRAHARRHHRPARAALARARPDADRRHARHLGGQPRLAAHLAGPGPARGRARRRRDDFGDLCSPSPWPSPAEPPLRRLRE